MDGNGKLLAGEIFVANPGSDHRQILNHDWTIDCIFLHGKKLDRAPAFLQGFLFSPQTRIDQAEHAHCGAIVWLSFDDFFLVRPCGSERSAGSRIVVGHSSDYAFDNRTIQMNSVVGQRCVTECIQCILCCSEVALCQRATQPVVGYIRQRVGIASSDGIDCLVQRFGVALPMKFDSCEPHFCIDVVRVDVQRAFPDGFLLSVAVEHSITECELLKREKVTRVEINRPLQIPCRFVPMSLPPLYDAGEIGYLWLIRQSLSRNFQVSHGTFVLDTSARQMSWTRDGGFRCIRTNTRRRLDGLLS